MTDEADYIDGKLQAVRRCRVCGITKPADQFYTGQGNTCKSCNNERTARVRAAEPLRYRATRSKWEKSNEGRAITRRKNRLKRRYNLSLEKIDEMLLAQKSRCLICETPLLSPSMLPRIQDESTGTRAVVDHDHNDGHVRGLLCSACNAGLGQFEDDIELLMKAIMYLETDLEKHSTGSEK